MFVGEQPGDVEDTEGRPFVGPAGKLLDRALEDAGIDRSKVFVTNAVKHFKFEQRGKRRLHSKPNIAEIKACNVWLEQEIKRIRPKLVVALGATAARAVLGRPVTVSSVRGSALALPDETHAWVTIHPSYLLRIREQADKDAEYRRFVKDLKAANAWIHRA